ADVWALPVAADTIAPNVALEALPQGTRGLQGWFVGPVDVLLSAQDERPGVVLIEYRLDGGSWQSYDEQFSVTESTAIDYRATDAAGNVSSTGQATVRIDTTAPAATHSVSAEEVAGWLASGTSISLAAQDADSGVAAIEYRFGGGEWT